MATTTTSKFLGLNIADLAKGAILAAITVPVNIILESLNAGNLTFDWKKIATVAAAGFLSYLVKNFFTPGVVTIKGLDPATVAAVKDGEASAKIVVPPTV